MKKKSKSIALSISIFFIFLNIISFTAIFYLIGTQYFKMAKRNITESNKITAASMERTFDDVRFYMNDLTLKIYSDRELNGFCSGIFREEYENDEQKSGLITKAEGRCYDYLYQYSFVNSMGIFIEDKEHTDIRLRKGQWYDSLTNCRNEIQEKVIEKQGVLECFEVGQQHQLVFARTLKDFKNVLEDDRIIGTVVLTLSPQYLTDALKNTLVTPNSFAALINEEGRVTYSTDRELKGKVFQEEYGEQEGYETFSAPLEVLGMDLVIMTPSGDINLSIGEFTRTLTLAILIIIALNLVLVLLISRSLTRPMDRLVRQIQDIGISSLKARHVQADGYSEIENIAENFNKMLVRVENLVKENYVIGLSEKNARIEALQSQINPHFIFNTLDTINWKVMFLDKPEVTNMISYLGDMLRYTTYQYGKYVNVEQEVRQIENYLYIQEIRYDHSFKTYIHIEEKAKKAVIPCLIIQPLVENSVVHGLRGKKNGVLVLRIRVRENKLEIMVFDNGHGMKADQINKVLRMDKVGTRESIGMANVNQRLILTYSLEQGLVIKSKVGYYTRIEMSIPLEKNEVCKGEVDDKSHCGGR